MIFKDIDMDSREELNPYFDLVDYEACEYCFNTLYMWQHLYKTGYYIWGWICCNSCRIRRRYFFNITFS